MGDKDIIAHRKMCATWLRELADRLEQDNLAEARFNQEPQYTVSHDEYGLRRLGPPYAVHYSIEFTLREPLKRKQQRPDRVRNW